ncbi:DnaD domain protein [Halobacillus shinanisalinarum]|uniref:DnaD domain protein n=1 Tax=Halobacillus shinanisalinarum TaxID=2932258 RepID=A0ABY4H0T2_9BACI|nr:DnaD domain protein [Halobacillus shinanisalinarum]UOQ94060.1 DnaD domain protein [Halobacillus shinanisalinarum]
MQGWIKLHRKILHSEIFENEKMLKVFIYCLTKSSHKEAETRVGRQKVQLEPGQFIFGRKKASAELNMNESTVRDYLKILQEDGVITIHSTNKYSVITVDNWAIYQSNEEDDDNKTTPESQQKDSPLPSKGQQKDTFKNEQELKEVKNVEEFIPTSTTGHAQGDAIQFYQTNFGMIRPQISEELLTWIEDLGEQMVIEAMKRSLDRNKPSWGYVKSILHSWVNKGVESLDQAQGEEVEYKNQQNSRASFSKRPYNQEVLPEWFKPRDRQQTDEKPKEQPSLESTARTIELGIKLKRSLEDILEAIDYRYDLSKGDIIAISEGRRSAIQILQFKSNLRIVGDP